MKVIVATVLLFFFAAMLLVVFFALPVRSEERQGESVRPYERLECLHYGRDYRNPCNPPPPPVIIYPPSSIVVIPGDKQPRRQPDLRDLHRNGIGGRR